MPIIRKHPLGNKEITAISFGIGDINMHPGVDPVNCLLLIQDKLKAVDNKLFFDDGKRISTDDLDADMIMMHFGSLKSINGVIEVLEVVKRNMEKQP